MDCGSKIGEVTIQDVELSSALLELSSVLPKLSTESFVLRSDALESNGTGATLLPCRKLPIPAIFFSSDTTDPCEAWLLSENCSSTGCIDRL